MRDLICDFITCCV